MIRDITIGQYYPTDSVIHRLDPRTKLVWTLAYIFSLFLFRSFASYAVATILLITVIKISKVPFKFMVKGMKAEDAIAKLEGIRCGYKPTSCPDQLAQALKQALNK